MSSEERALREELEALQVRRRSLLEEARPSEALQELEAQLEAVETARDAAVAAEPPLGQCPDL